MPDNDAPAPGEVPPEATTAADAAAARERVEADPNAARDPEVARDAAAASGREALFDYEVMTDTGAAPGADPMPEPPPSVHNRGQRIFFFGLASFAIAVLVGVLGFIVASFGQFPALVLVLVALPLGIWGVRRIRAGRRSVT